jgi:hypothetical protein
MEKSKPKRGRPKGSKNKIETERVIVDGKVTNVPLPKKPKVNKQNLPNGQRHYLKTTNHVYTELAKTAISSTD